MTEFVWAVVAAVLLAVVVAAYRRADARRTVLGRRVAVPWELGEAEGTAQSFVGPEGAPRLLVDLGDDVLPFDAAHVRFVRRPRLLDRVWPGRKLSPPQLARQR